MPETAHVASGKVREIYALDDERLLLVASDRISTFDVVLPTEIPDKGRVLTGLSGVLVRADEADRPEPPARAARRRPLDRVPAARDAAGRVRRARLHHRLRLEGLPRDRRGLRASLPEGLSESERLPGADLHAVDEGADGHDENITREQAAELVGGERFDEVERIALELYRFASAHARARGIILADTKFEFGIDDDGLLVLADEAFTPDSSRFWPADRYEPGGSQPSFDKQYVRDYCESVGWDKTYPGPELPEDVVVGDAREVHRGVRAADRNRVRRRTSPTRKWCCDEGDRSRPSEGGHPRPAGAGGRAVAAQARLRRRASARSAASSSRRRGVVDATRRASGSTRCASSCSRIR